ncbi:MAG: HAD-IA family hydrolase, partial [Holophagales bacterium]|nr:HAD-IA family hydrolase [Holophagales bacterium]
LAPHPDVRPALERLREAGFRLVALTNSAHGAMEAQLENASLRNLFHDALSVEEVGLYKPHTHVYRWACRRQGVAPEEAMMVAAHGWDVAGAQWAGLRAAFLARPPRQLFPLAPNPEIVADDLEDAADALIALPASG